MDDIKELTGILGVIMMLWLCLSEHLFLFEIQTEILTNERI